MQDEIIHLLPMRRGHFRLESGHHGDLWLDLELLYLDPAPVRRLAKELASRVVTHHPEVICGPLVEGAFVALMVAEQLGLPFCYAERFGPSPAPAETARQELYPVEYRVPPALRDKVRGKRVAVVNDVINAGSAVRGTMDDLAAGEAHPAAIGALLVLGDWAREYATAQGVALETLAALPNAVWAPAECPLCKESVPFEN